MKNILLFVALISSAGNLQSQSATNEFEMQEFARSFMSAYNQQDHAALRKMYSEYAIRVDTEGKEMTGANQIIAYFQNQFIDNNVTLFLKPSTISWSEKENAYVAKGTYEMIGKTNVYDIKINTKGAYTNTMIKDKDQWQIAKSVLTPLVKVMVYHQVDDFSKWKSGIEQGLPMRLAAGELSEEIGSVHGEPNTAYFISEWISIEAFETFFSNPELEKKMQKAGVTGKSTVLILDRK